MSAEKGLKIMKNITVNITGDVNVILPTTTNAMADEDRLIGVIDLVSDDDLPDTCFILDSEDEEIDDGMIHVLYMIPGKQSEIITLIEALKKMESAGGCDRVRRVPTYDLQMAYNAEGIVAVGKDKYLLSPAIVFYSIDGEPEPIRMSDAGVVRRLMEERTVTLSNGEMKMSAYLL